jgi:hypothetical protein
MTKHNTFQIDDTDERLDPIGQAIKTIIRDEHNIPEEHKIIPYGIDAWAPDHRFSVTTIIKDEHDNDVTEQFTEQHEISLHPDKIQK